MSFTILTSSGQKVFKQKYFVDISSHEGQICGPVVPQNPVNKPWIMSEDLCQTPPSQPPDPEKVSVLIFHHNFSNLGNIFWGKYVGEESSPESVQVSVLVFHQTFNNSGNNFQA